MSKSRGHARHEEHEEHEEHVNHEAWVIPYADLLTLLMALFLVLFAVGRTDLEKFKKMAQSFKQEFGNSATSQVVSLGGSGDNPTGDGGSGILAADVTPQQTKITTTVPPVTTTPADAALAEKTAAESAAQTEKSSLEGVEQSVQAAADAFGLGSSLDFTLDARGLVITIVTDQVLFLPGDASLQSEGLSVLDVVAQALAKVPNEVSVEGHTGNRPISSAKYPSNWELSNARATSVLRYLIDQSGIPASRLSATGWADQRPIADNATVEGAAKNRRVEIVVKAAVPLSSALDGGSAVAAPGDAGSAAVTPSATSTTLIVDPQVIPSLVPPGASGDSASAGAATEGSSEVASEAPVADVEAITGTSSPTASTDIIPIIDPHVDPTRPPGSPAPTSGQ